MISCLNNSLTKVKHIWDKARHDIQVYRLHRHATSKPDECHPKESTLEILKKLQELRKGRPSTASVVGSRRDKIQQPDEYNEQTHEYLSIVLPKSASHPVEILGSPKNANLKFLMRAEHVLTILRVVSTHLDNSTQFSELTHVDQLLKEVTALICGIESRKESYRKCSTCRMQK